MKKLLIIGKGGHGKVIAEIAYLNGYKSVDFLDDNEKSYALGKICDYIKYIDSADFIVGIGNSKVREKIQQELLNNGANIISLFHPRSIISNTSTIGKGCVAMAGAVVNPHTQIHNGVILNTNCSVDHDCVVEDFSHISVGAKICGTVNIGRHTWIGAGATVINNTSVCANCMIGAGATVVNNITSPNTYVGIPAKTLERKIQNATV